ncbi:DUF5641 domain-containing protein [Trichonephila clavipes]|nr:DUF5641 domain-containing protein [Trichonephila clavipes]
MHQKSSHLSRNCPERITCKNCKKFHCDILCYATEIKTADHKSSGSNMLNDEISSSLLVNKSFMKQVFLQTLVVCINVNKSDYYVRVLIDSGSVKSYPICSVNSKEKLDKLIVESQEILEEGKFELRGWEHNNLDPQTENTVPTERRSVPVLGLKWDLDQDLLSVDIKVHESKNEILTKRKILSLVHKIFDPIGFTCPVTLIPKNNASRVLDTQSQIRDSELPASIWQKFQKWKDQLDRLKAIAVPRCMIEDPETSQNLSLHVFCDASKAAYATCIFLRSGNKNSASCQLVQARSRVAPLKSISIPRLELLACTMGQGLPVL